MMTNMHMTVGSDVSAYFHDFCVSRRIITARQTCLAQDLQFLLDERPEKANELSSPNM